MKHDVKDHLKTKVKMS